MPIPPTTAGSPLKIAAPIVPTKAHTTASTGELLTATALATITDPITSERMPDCDDSGSVEAALPNSDHKLHDKNTTNDMAAVTLRGDRPNRSRIRMKLRATKSNASANPAGKNRNGATVAGIAVP